MYPALKNLQSLRQAALGPHYLKRLESSLKLPGIYNPSRSKPGQTKRRKGSYGQGRGKELPEGTQTMSLFEATMTGTLSMTMTGVAGVAGAHAKRPNEKAEVLSAMGRRGAPPKTEKLPAIGQKTHVAPKGQKAKSPRVATRNAASPRQGGTQGKRHVEPKVGLGMTDLLGSR
jgi:hypothetical protein